MGAQNGTGNGEVRDTLILGQTSQGTEIHASLLRLTRYGVSFEIYNPGMVLRTSEVLHDFKILLNGSSVYAGRAVIRNLVNTGSVLVCEATLDDSWLEKNALARNGHDRSSRWSLQICRRFSRNSECGWRKWSWKSDRRRQVIAPTLRETWPTTWAAPPRRC